MSYGTDKDLPRRTAYDKVLHHKAIDSNPQHDGYQCGLVSMISKCFNKKSRNPTTHTGKE